METSTRNLLIEQVTEYLKALPFKDRVRELIYNYFLPQCNQYEITEDEFYKQILKSAFKEAEPAPEEDPDPPNRKGTFVRIFGVTLHSLKRLGEVLFEDAGREKIYFDDVTFLKAHVDQLEDADAAIAYTLLYQSEHDPEKRYLKICYQLNPGLPYRIDGELFGSPEALLSAGFKSWSLMEKIYSDYGSGKLPIWLHGQNPERLAPLPGDQNRVSFLAFVYRVNARFPFYIEQELFYAPIDLVVKAQKNLDFWPKLMKCCSNGELFVWFNALGYADWRGKLRKVYDDFQQKNPKGEDEKVYPLIQQLLYIIDTKAIRPHIVASVAKIEMLNVEATQLVEVKVRLNLKTLGFVQARVVLESLFEGLTLDKAQAVLFDLTGQKQEVVTLYIDPQKLEKNTEYQTVLQIISPYETVNIPVRLKVVFPLRTFFLYLLKYSLFGALFFGFFRGLLAAGTRQAGGLAPRIITTAVSRSLPDNYAIFYWVFMAMLTAFIISIVAIRKVEKI